MDRAEVLAQIKSIAVEQFGTGATEISEGTSFVDDLGADSLDVVTMVIAFEEAFGISIPDDRIESLGLVRDVIDFVIAERA